MNKLIVIIIFILTLPLADAGIYQCQSGNDNPIFTANESDSSKSRNEYTTKTPQISDNFLSSRVHKGNKIPFLIYYAIDSSEPFMQLSISYEIAQLQKKCRASDNVNFAAILNSLYVERNEIIICKNKIVQRLNLDRYHSVSESLKTKRKFISTGDHSTADIGIMKYWVRYREVTNSAFGNFPLAHPDFLYDLVNLVISEKELFPISKYMPFLNLKSHGSKHTVLSGLYDCQVKAKTLNQHKIIEDILSKDEISKLKELNVNLNHNIEPEEFEKILSKLKLDSEVGNGASEQDTLGDTNLGISAFGLGADDGLGTQLAFGVYHITLNALLDDLFNTKNGQTLGFMMLESCDSNRENLFKKEKNPMILGVYSAQYSLWYRNLNWWEILEFAGNSTKDMMKELSERTKKIINIKEIK